MRHLLATTLLVLLAACTSDESLAPGREGAGDSGAVSFSITGLSSGSTQTRAALAVQEENEIKTLDIYVFAYDDNANLADAPSVAPATIDEGQWYLQEKWSYNAEAPIEGNGTTLRSFTLGGSGAARTAVIYPQKGRFLRFFMVANAEVLTHAADESAFELTFTTLDGMGEVATTGTKAADFLNLRLRLAKPDEAKPDEMNPDAVNPPHLTNITCPLPMTAQMTADVTQIADMRTTAEGGASDAPQVALTMPLSRAVARFDVINKATLWNRGFFLTSVRVRNGFRYVGMTNTIPVGSAFEKAVEKDLGGMAWADYLADYVEGEEEKKIGEILTSAFYTSPTLGGADNPMVISLYGKILDTWSNYTQPLSKDVELRDAFGDKIEVKANSRYVLTIEKLEADNLVLALNVRDWNSLVLTPSFDDNAARSPLVESVSTDGIEWYDNYRVTIDNTTPGKVLGFNIRKAFPFNSDVPAYSWVPIYGVRVLAADPRKNWLEDAVLTLIWGTVTEDGSDAAVTLKVKSETEVPLKDRGELLLQVYNVQRPEIYHLITVESEWKPEEKPAATTRGVQVKGLTKQR